MSVSVWMNGVWNHHKSDPYSEFLPEGRGRRWQAVKVMAGEHGLWGDSHCSMALTFRHILAEFTAEARGSEAHGPRRSLVPKTQQWGWTATSTFATLRTCTWGNMGEHPFGPCTDIFTKGKCSCSIKHQQHGKVWRGRPGMCIDMSPRPSFQMWERHLQYYSMCVFLAVELAES